MSATQANVLRGSFQSGWYKLKGISLSESVT